MLSGNLPWINYKNKPEKEIEVLKLKQEISIQSLWYGLPVEWLFYMGRIKNLGPNAKIDYTELKQIFLKRFKHSEFEFDYQYDWNSLFSKYNMMFVTFWKLSGLFYI